MSDELALITNARAGACMCGRTEGVEYGPHIFGYGPCCVACQREWSRQHGGARWISNAEQLSRLHAERARAEADGRDLSEVTKAWNGSLPPFDRPKRTDGLSQSWREEYDAYWAAQGTQAVDEYPS